MAEIHDMWVFEGPQPNGLQAVDDGLWVIDQVDNYLYKVNYDDGSVIEKIPTETEHSSGVTVGNGNIWVASTYTCELVKMDLSNGDTVAKFTTPGKGVVAFAKDPATAPVSGAHGMEWIDNDNMWIAVPPAQKVYLMDPKTMHVKRSFDTPDMRPHGLFMHEGSLWLADTGLGKIHKLNPDTGEVLDEIDVAAPEVHGMTIHDGNIWFCCAETRRVCTVPLPA